MVVEIKFKDKEDVYDWIQNFLVQNDYRYVAFPEEITPLIHFIYNDAISVEKKPIPFIEKPQNKDLEKIKGPQKEHKYLALKLLDLECMGKNKAYYEFVFHGRIADIYVDNGGKTILIECGSCYTPKVLEYLEQQDTELWIITKGKEIWQDNKLNPKNLHWFILKRNKNWDECYERYKNYKGIEFKKMQEYSEEKREIISNAYYLTPGEINKMIDATKNLRDKVVLKILARTGIRRSELCNLMIKAVNFDNKSLFIEHGKGGKSRHIPIDEDTLQDIKLYLNNRRYGKLIQSNNKTNDGIDESRINEIVRKVAEKADIKNPDHTKKHLNPHIIRHSFFSNMIKAGASLNHVQQIAGHGDIRTIIQMYYIPEFKDTQETYEKAIKEIYKK